MSVGRSGHVQFGLEKSVAGTCNASVLAVGVGGHGKGGPIYVVVDNVVEVLFKLCAQFVTVTMVVAVDTELQLVVVVHVGLLCNRPWSVSLLPRSRCFSARRRL